MFTGSIDAASNNHRINEYVEAYNYGYLIVKDCVLTIYIKLRNGNDSIYYEVE